MIIGTVAIKHKPKTGNIRFHIPLFKKEESKGIKYSIIFSYHPNEAKSKTEEQEKQNRINIA